MASYTKQTIGFYFRQLKKYKLVLFLLTISIIIATGAELFKPFLYKEFFNILAVGSFDSSKDSLVRIIVGVLAVSITHWFFWRVADFSVDYIIPRIMVNLTNDSFEYLHGHSYNFFNNTFIGSLSRKVNRFVRGFENVFMEFYWKISTTFFKIGTMLVIVYFLYPIVALCIGIWLVIYLGFVFWFISYKNKYDIIKSDLDSQVGGYLADTVTNNLNVKVFTNYKKEYTAFTALTEKLFYYRKLSWNLGSMVEAFQGIAMILLEFAVMYVAIILWKNGTITIGDFALLQAYLIGVFNSLWDVERSLRNIFEGLADAGEMTEILTTPHEVKDVENAGKLVVAQGKIDLKDVTFAYNKNNIFEHFNLTIQPGQKIAVVGPSGGGKSTLVKLLFRFFDLSAAKAGLTAAKAGLDSGEITIDDQNIASVTQDSLRANLSLVPQEPILFHRTLLENIRYAKPNATKEEVMAAAKLAHCHEFILSFPQQYDTYVGERGVKLSGGERQRVAIARAILKDAPILVLDEATSSLDSQSEQLIQAALKNLMKDKTTIVIAHRLSTIMQMDRIIVIDDGKIIEDGHHEELIKAKQGTYQKLWEIQAGGFVQ